MDNKNPFPFCDDKTKTIKENIICEQHKMHNAMTDNALSFILFYVFTVLFIAFLFQLTKKTLIKERKIVGLFNLLNSSFSSYIIVHSVIFHF